MQNQDREVLFEQYPDQDQFKFLVKADTRYSKTIYVNPEEQRVYVGFAPQGVEDIALDAKNLMKAVQQDLQASKEQGQPVNLDSALNAIDMQIQRRAAQLCGGQVTIGKDFDPERHAPVIAEGSAFDRMKTIDLSSDFANYNQLESVSELLQKMDGQNQARKATPVLTR